MGPLTTPSCDLQLITLFAFVAEKNIVPMIKKNLQRKMQVMFTFCKRRKYYMITHYFILNSDQQLECILPHTV